MNIEQLKAQLRDLYKRGGELAAKAQTTGLTEAEVTEAKEVRQKISTYKSQLDDLEALDFEEMRAGNTQYNAGTGARAAAATDGHNPGHSGRGESRSAAAAADAAEYRSLSERFVESDAFTEFREARRSSSDPVMLGSFFHDGAVTMRHRRGMTPEEIRVQTVGALPAGMAPVFRVPGIFVPDSREYTVRSAWLNGQTNSGSIEFFRELLWTNNAAFVAEATATSGSSGLKPESSLTFDKAVATVETIAHWVAITNQTLDDVPQMQTIIEGRLIDGLRDVEDEALLNGDGSGASILGVREHTDIQSLDAAYFGTNPVQDDGESIENFNRILRARRLSRQVGRGRPSAIFLNPEDLEGFLTTTDANRQYMAGGPFNNGGIPNIWGLRVIETESQESGWGTVVDGRAGAVWDRMQASIAIDTIDNQFVRNMRTILAEERLAFSLYRPQTVVDVELAAW